MTTPRLSTDLGFTPEQIILLADVVESAMNATRDDCWVFEPGDKDWTELVSRAKQLQAILSEIESAMGRI